MTERQASRMALFATLLGSEWDVRFNAYLNTVQASLRRAEIRAGTCGLLGVSGCGATPEAAVRDYLGRLEGQLLILRAFDSDRREVQMPRGLAADILGMDNGDTISESVCEALRLPASTPWPDVLARARSLADRDPARTLDEETEVGDGDGGGR